MSWIAVVFAANVAFDYLVLNPYSPPPVAYAGFAVLAALLVLVARHLPARIGVGVARRRTSVRRIALVGFVAAVSVFMVVGDGFPDSGLPAPVAAIAPFALALLVILFSLRSGASAWSPRQQLALAAGALSFWIILAPAQEFAAGAIGMTLVGAATAYSLWRLNRRLPPVSEVGGYPTADRWDGKRAPTRQPATGRARPVTLRGSKSQYE